MLYHLPSVLRVAPGSLPSSRRLPHPISLRGQWESCGDMAGYACAYLVALGHKGNTEVTREGSSVCVELDVLFQKAGLQAVLSTGQA